MASTTLRVNGDVSAGGWTNEIGTGALWSHIDDMFADLSGTDYIQGAQDVAIAAGLFDMDNTPADFGNPTSGLSPQWNFVYSLSKAGGDDQHTFFYNVVDASGNILIATTSTVATSFSWAQISQVSSFTAAGYAANKATWDAARMQLWTTYSRNMGADTIGFRLSSIWVSIPYDTSSDTTPPTVNITTSNAKISRIVGKDAYSISFTLSESCQAYEFRRVAAAGDSRASGTLIGSQRTGTYSGTINDTITDDELVAAGAVEGANLVKVFAQDTAGNWST